MKLERVRGDLHRARHIPLADHLPERPLQVDRFGSRPHDLALFAADDGFHRAEQARLPAVGLEQGADEESGRRLPVRTGDADGLQLRGRIAIEARRGRSHRSPDAVHADLGNAETERSLNDERDRSPGNRLGGELVAVAREAHDAEEQRPGPDRPGVGGEGCNLNLGGRRAVDDVLQEHRLGGYSEPLPE